MSQKLIENKQVIVQDNPKWRKELDALFRYEALKDGKGKKETELDKSRKVSKSTRSKDREAT